MIFPEGSITRSGELERFRPGVTRILEANPVPVIPMALSGLWGSFFSRKDGAAMSKPWRFVPFRKIRLSVGDAVAPAQAAPEFLQARVLELRGDWR
jgi:1-acyl-sn-glycerol-3-phosphate acyltransferase